jgi:uncharacterized protein YecT (DUF1311 family)
MKRFLLTAALMMAFPALAAAEDNCANAQDQATMNACAGASFEKSDAELNVLYKQITGRLKDDADTSRLLVTAQRAWVGFRDAECSFASSENTGGSLYPMVLSACKEGLTQARIKDFQTYLSCKQEDTGCPVPAAN